MITGQQIRIARNALRWSVDVLADQVGVSAKTIRRIEAFDGLPDSTVKTISHIQRVFESAGIEFIGSPDDAPGIRIRTRKT